MINTIDGKINDKGQLDIAVEYANPFIWFSDWAGGDTKAEFDGAAAINKMKKKLTDNLNGLKTYIETNVKDSLKQAQFVLAGAGYFTMHNPIFTNKGDLLVEVKYKGYRPP